MIVLISVCPVLRSLPVSGEPRRCRQLQQRRNVGAQVRRGIRVRDAFLDRRVRVDHARRDVVVVRLEPLFERGQRRVRGRFGQEDLGAAAPDHHEAIAAAVSLEAAHVLAQLVGEVALVLALLDVRSVEPLDVAPIEHRGHRLDRFELGTDLLEQRPFENAGSLRRLVGVVFEDVPAAEHDVVERRERNEILDERRARLPVRLPRRTVPICVSDPIGRASPRRTASTPAMVVVLTAPMPTSRTPSFPVAGSIFGGFFTMANYIIEYFAPL